jgi:hypothetical protein
MKAIRPAGGNSARRTTSMESHQSQCSHLEDCVVPATEAGAQKEISTNKLLQARIAPRDQSLAELVGESARRVPPLFGGHPAQ